ncbi:uncharacterized protein [Littorina saxatilis]|uniref:uncharacterized protein n=1 Tax=Littorina saxatilis TaxID=31220 RepID=UPI0038B4A931
MVLATRGCLPLVGDYVTIGAYHVININRLLSLETDGRVLALLWLFCCLLTPTGHGSRLLAGFAAEIDTLVREAMPRLDIVASSAPRLGVENFCSEVELQLTKIPKHTAQRWMRNTGEYAVWADKELDIRMHLARRYLDAVSYLLGLNTKESSGRFNPYEALVKFTQFIKLLADRRQAQQMPDLHAFLFWIEIFTTLGLYLVDKCSGSHTVSALPACYFRNLHMLNLVEPGGQDTLQVWMENHNPRDSNNKASRKFVLGRIQYLTRVLCGVHQGDFSLLGYLLKLDKKDPSHFLLLERALVVSLVLLLNCRLEGVSEEHLVPILRTVKGVCENTQGMPDRLKSLADSLRDAQDYSHVFKALESTLKGMGEQLQFYRWHWKERGSMPQVERKPNIPQGPLPSLEMVLKKETGEGQGPQASESIQDGLNQQAQNEDVQEEDEEMVSAEEIANLKQRLLDRRVANAIFCWKEFVKRNRKKKISGDRDLDIMTLFPLNPITETTCGICGESYEQASVDEMEIQTEDDLEDEGMIPAVSKATRVTQRQEHEHSWEHLQQYTEYQEFREVCQQRIARPLHDAGHFFSNIQIEKKAALYKDHPHEFHSYEKYKKVRQAVQHTIANQNWGEQESLCQQVAELQDILTDRKVKTIFHNIFNDNEVKAKILYRVFQHARVNDGKPLRQVLVPQPLRRQVMEVAHDSIMGGHLGVKKTSDRIQAAFYWPGLHTDKCKDSKEQPQKVTVTPGTEFTVENLRLRKAEECLKSGEEEEMLRTLDDALPEEQIAFLQKNNRFDIAAKTMFQEGARSEAVWLLLHNGMFDMAIEHAEKSKDIELRAHCYLNKARRLIHSEASSEKESTNTGFGKPKNTVPETWDKVVREAEQLLDEALKLFKQCSKHNEAGECLLLLAHLKDKNYVVDALQFFQQKGHLANFAAVLECYETLYKPADPKECLKMDKFACQHLLEGMDYSSELVLLLLDGEHSNSQYLQCLHFFGLDVPDSSSLTFYPCLNPRWLKITKKKIASMLTLALQSDDQTVGQPERKPMLLPREFWQQ